MAKFSAKIWSSTTKVYLNDHVEALNYAGPANGGHVMVRNAREALQSLTAFRLATLYLESAYHRDCLLDNTKRSEVASMLEAYSRRWELNRSTEGLP